MRHLANTSRDLELNVVYVSSPYRLDDRPKGLVSHASSIHNTSSGPWLVYIYRVGKAIFVTSFIAFVSRSRVMHEHNFSRDEEFPHDPEQVSASGQKNRSSSIALVRTIRLAGQRQRVPFQVSLPGRHHLEKCHTVNRRRARRSLSAAQSLNTAAE